MDRKEFESRFNLLKPYIVKAGEQIIRMRNAPDFNVEIKPDKSPVSNADIWANSYFSEIIQKNFPGEIIVGEESEDKSYPKGSELIWYIDPIDGTKNYVKGSDHFYILIGLSIDGIPSFGIYYKPVTGQFITGYGKNNVYLVDHSDNQTPLSANQYIPENSAFIMKRVDQELKEALKNKFGIERHHYIKDKVEMLGPLFGESNGYITMRRTAFWDLCTPAAIMRAAGYEIANQSDQSPVLFNGGGYKSDYFFSLPPNTPNGVKKLLFQYLK